MLVLTRKEGQKILIGEEIEITVVRISANSVRLGLQAPHRFKIIREEVGHKTDAEPAAADDAPAPEAATNPEPSDKKS